MKKITLLLMALTVFLAVALPDTADARRGGGGFKAPKQGYTQNPSQPARQTDNVRNTDPGTRTPAVNTPGAAAGNRGFFAGGGLMRGLMIGGLAGLLFGSMFAGMGFLGNFLGLLVNVLAIYFLFILVRSVFRYFRNQNRKPDDSRRPY